MKKVIRKFCVFLLAVTFFGKALYSDIQYARADEYAGPEITVTEGENSEGNNQEGDVVITLDEPVAGDVSGGDASEEEPVENGDVSGGDVSGGDVSEGDVSGGDVSGGDVSGGDVSGGDVSGGDVSGGEPGPEIEEPKVNKNTDISVHFYVLKKGCLSNIDPEQTGEGLTQNPQKNFITGYVIKKNSGFSLEKLKNNYSYDNLAEIGNYIVKGKLYHVALPDEYGTYESVSEVLGINKQYGENGVEYLIENLLADANYVSSVFVYFTEQNEDGTDTRNLIYATGDMVDWYVLKHADSSWHADGYLANAKAIVAEENKPVGVPAVYTYDGTSKVPAENTLVENTVYSADDALPGEYVINNIVFKDASGNVISDIVNAGSYSAVAEVKYVYSNEEDELSYESSPFDVIFPVTVEKRLVTITAKNDGKVYGQPDPVLTGTISGAVDADPVSASFYRIKNNEAVGSYPIFITYEASGNYKVVTYDGTFTITAPSSGPTPTPVTPPGPTPGPEPEEVPGIVVPEPTPVAPATPVPPAPVEPEDTVELEEEDVPLADGPVDTAEEEITGDAESLDVGDVYPPLRDLTIEDEETPLAAAPGDCWIHWLIVLLTALDLLYTVIQAFRNGAVIKKLKSN